MTIERYCICGKVLRVNAPKAKRNQVLAVWFSYHSGDGHAPATRNQAKEARAHLNAVSPQSEEVTQ